MENERRVRLFRDGRHQALRISREFELPGNQAILRKEGRRLVVEPVGRRRDLRELLPTLSPLYQPFPAIADTPATGEDIFRGTPAALRARHQPPRHQHHLGRDHP